jgi:hypothetical protein
MTLLKDTAGTAGFNYVDLDDRIDAFGLNVKSYGAIGDGVTDDRAAFVAALAVGDIFVPEWTYMFGSASMSIPAGRTIRGAGIEATTLKLADDVDGRLFTATSGAADITITSLTVDGNSANNTGASSYGFQYADATRLTITDTRWLSAAADTLVLSGTPVDCRIDGNSFTGTGSSMSTVIRSDGDTVISNNQIRDAVATSGVIWIESDCTVTGNRIVQTVTPAPGISIRGDRNAVTGNIIDHSAIPVPASASKTLITGSISASYNTVAGNTLTGCQKGAGIHMGAAASSTASYNTISGNVISNVSSDGIILGVSTPTGTGNVVSGNTVSDVYWLGSGDFGVGIETPLLNTLVVGNTLTNIEGTGIYAGASTIITGNVFRNCVSQVGGASFAASIRIGQSGCRIQGNTILDTGTTSGTYYGILVQPDDTSTSITDLTVDGNRIGDTRSGASRTTDYGMRITNNGAATVSGVKVGGNDFRNCITDDILDEQTSVIATGGNLWSTWPTLPSVASTAALTLPEIGHIVSVTGTTAITSIAATGMAGREVTLIFTGTAATTGLTAGSNLKIPANFVHTANDTYRLVCDGTNWYSLGAGSVNP